MVQHPVFYILPIKIKNNELAIASKVFNNLGILLRK